MEPANTMDQGSNKEINVNPRRGPLLQFKPEMLQTFYIFLGISFILILLIIYRMYKYVSYGVFNSPVINPIHLQIAFPSRRTAIRSSRR